MQIAMDVIRNVYCTGQTVMKSDCNSILPFGKGVALDVNLILHWSARILSASMGMLFCIGLKEGFCCHGCSNVAS